MSDLFDVDYDRQTIRIEISKHILEISEYSNLTLDTFAKWINKLKEYDNIKIDSFIIDKDYDDGGCGCYTYKVLQLIPYITREETDEEYRKRIAKEEKRYLEQQEKIKLREQNYVQYLKDLDEFNRIKEKYHL